MKSATKYHFTTNNIGNVPSKITLDPNGFVYCHFGKGFIHNTIRIGYHTVVDLDKEGLVIGVESQVGNKSFTIRKLLRKAGIETSDANAFDVPFQILCESKN